MSNENPAMFATAEISNHQVAIRPILEADSSAVLSAILSASDYGVLFTGLDHVALACNRKFADIWEVPIEDVVRSGVQNLRQKVASLIPDMTEWEANLEQVYADPAAEQVDELVLLKSPNLWIRRFTGPVFGADGSIVGRIWTFRDISVEIRQRELRDALNRLSIFFADRPDVVYNRIVEEVVAAFPGAVALLSILEGDWLEFKASAGFPEEAKAITGNSLEESFCQFCIASSKATRILDGSKDPRTQNVLPVKFGYVRYMGVPFYDHQGKVIGTLCVIDREAGKEFDDEEERFLSLLSMRASGEFARERHLAERLAEKERVLQSQLADLNATRDVLEAMNSGFSLLSEDLETEALISRQKQILGSLGLGDWNWPENWEQSLSEAVNGLELKLDEQPCDDLQAAHVEALREQVSIVLATQLLKEQLIRTTDELKATQDRLLQSEKLSVVGTLAAATAHDIRNILSSVALEIGMGDENPEKALMSVRENLDRFKVLAHRLLSYARPRMIAKQSVSVTDLLDRVLGLTAGHARVLGVQVRREVPQTLSSLNGDPNQLEHLFVNLVLNALQAMSQSGGAIDIIAKSSKGRVSVSISDSGVGMSEDQLNKLFVPFQTSKQDGTGLGLFSCKRIVEDHGGSIEATSASGKGTTFVVTLPATLSGRKQ